MKHINGNTKITLTIRQLKCLIKESLISEDKTKMINRLVLPDISDEDEKEKYKALLINFFKSHSNYENKVDWHKVKTLTKKDFDSIMQSAENSKSNIKRQAKAEIATDIKNIFKTDGDKRFKFVSENDNWLFISPLSYEAAKYCNSSVNQGAGAKWCIGYEDDDSYWNDYIENGSSFIMAFNKNYKTLAPKDKRTDMKYMIQLDEDNEIHIWNQLDDDIGNDVTRFGISLDQVDQMFASVKNDFIAIKRDNYKKTYGEPIEVGEDSFIFCKDGVLTKYDGDATDIVIPNGVTSIGDYAFDECDNLTSVTIPPSVTSIGHGAFSGCSGLTSVTIPDSVMNIGELAFYGCSGLTSVTIPEGVTNIRAQAFSSCAGLKSVMIPSSVTSIKVEAFAYCKSLKSITIPSSVSSIEDYAFSYCNNLTSVTIPNGVMSIGKYAFSCCRRLSSVIIPSSMTSIENGMFYCCRGLTSVTIPSSVTSIGEAAFFNCDILTKLKAPWLLIKKYIDTFKGCPVYEQIWEKLKQEK